MRRKIRNRFSRTYSSLLTFLSGISDCLNGGTCTPGSACSFGRRMGWGKRCDCIPFLLDGTTFKGHYCETGIKYVHLINQGEHTIPKHFYKRFNSIPIRLCNAVIPGPPDWISPKTTVTATGNYLLINLFLLQFGSKQNYSWV